MRSAILSVNRSYVALQANLQPRHQRVPHPGPLVLGAARRTCYMPTVDRDQPVSRRFKPNSRTALMGEQPNPSNRFQLEDAMSRHRGAKRFRR